MQQKNPLSTDPIHIASYIPALMTIIANKLSSGASSCYRKHFNVGVMEWRIMAMLRGEKNVSANRISQKIGLDKSAISRTLKQLQKNELVTFSKDELDARSSLIMLTLEGEELHDRIVKVAINREEIFLEGITQHEQALFIELLNKMNNNIEKTNAYSPSE